MAKEKLTITIEQMNKVRSDAGQNPLKIKNSATVFSSMPLEGTFSHVGTKEFDIPNVGKRTAVGLYLVKSATEKEAGFVSENAINAQMLEDIFAVIKSGSRKGRHSLKSVRLTDMAKFKLGDSADARLVALQGRKFKAVKKNDCRIYKSEYLDSTKFDEVCYLDNTAENLKDALSKTETKDLYEFDFPKA